MLQSPELTKFRTHQAALWCQISHFHHPIIITLQINRHNLCQNNYSFWTIVKSALFKEATKHRTAMLIITAVLNLLKISNRILVNNFNNKIIWHNSRVLSLTQLKTHNRNSNNKIRISSQISTIPHLPTHNTINKTTTHNSHYNIKILYSVHSQNSLMTSNKIIKTRHLEVLLIHSRNRPKTIKTSLISNSSHNNNKLFRQTPHHFMQINNNNRDLHSHSGR